MPYGSVNVIVGIPARRGLEHSGVAIHLVVAVSSRREPGIHT